jgi:hypothetical protein
MGIGKVVREVGRIGGYKNTKPDEKKQTRHWDRVSSNNMLSRIAHNKQIYVPVVQLVTSNYAASLIPMQV